jgi:hypothetical protein
MQAFVSENASSALPPVSVSIINKIVLEKTPRKARVPFSRDAVELDGKKRTRRTGSQLDYMPYP